MDVRVFMEENEATHVKDFMIDLNIKLNKLDGGTEDNVDWHGPEYLEK